MPKRLLEKTKTRAKRRLLVLVPKTKNTEPLKLHDIDIKENSDSRKN